MIHARQVGMLLGSVVLAYFGFSGQFGTGQLGAGQFDRPATVPAPPACSQPSSVTSPDGSHSAFISCLGNEEVTRTLQLTVMDSSGRQISTLSTTLKQSCTPGALSWLDNDRVGVVCRTDPEVKTYVVFNIQAGSELQYPGYSFQWSPDRKYLADVKVDVLFGTPAGENSCLYMNGDAVYPPNCSHARSTYTHIHSFIAPLLWSPDSTRVAFVEKIFDWEYADPFLRYFDGAASDVHYYLVIASIDHTASGYSLSPAAAQQIPVWQTNSRLMLGNQAFDLQSRPPSTIP